MCGLPCQIQRHAKFLAKTKRKAKVFAGQIHGKVDIVTAVENDLTFGFKHETIAGTGLNHMKGLRQIQPAFFGQHQRLARRHQMNKGQHIGDDLDHRRLADGPDIENLAAHGLQSGAVALKHGRLAANNHRDLAASGQMHAARHRTFERINAIVCGQSGHFDNFLAVIGAHFNPGASPFQSGQNPARAGQHLHGNRR